MKKKITERIIIENEKTIIERITETEKKPSSLSIIIWGFLSVKIEDLKC